MYYCNDFYSLSILSLYEGELIGVVNKLYFDKKLKKLLFIELINDDGIKMMLATKNIYNIGKNAITVKNNQAVSLKIESQELTSCPIGSKAYSINGEYLGLIKEMSFSDKFLTEKISLDNNNILDIENLASCGKNTVIFYDQNSKININKFTPQKSPKTFKTEEVATAEILPFDQTSKPTPQLVKENSQPTTQNSDFLIGRKCTKDIFNFNNEILIKCNSVITKKNLKDINKFGKLRELMIFSK